MFGDSGMVGVVAVILAVFVVFCGAVHGCVRMVVWLFGVAVWCGCVVWWCEDGCVVWVCGDGCVVCLCRVNV